MRGDRRPSDTVGGGPATGDANRAGGLAQAHASRAVLTGEGLADLQSVWHELEREGAGNPFLTFAWMDAWWREFGQDQEPYVVLVSDRHGRTLGLAPLMRSMKRSRLGGKLKTLRFMGDPGSDRLGFVSRMGRERDVATAIAEWLRVRRQDWHVISLANIVEDSEELSAMTRCFGGGHVVVDQPGLGCPYLSIDGDWASYLQARSSNFRSELRRGRRRLEGDLGGRFRICSDPEDVRQALDFLFRHSIERLEDGPGSSFASPRFRAFHLDVATRLLALGRLSVWVLEIEGETAAVLYDLVAGDTVWFYNAAFAAQWGPLKPGAVLLGRAIEDAFERGAREFDFLLGDYPYKRRWTATTRQHRVLNVIRPGPAAILDAALPVWWDLAKEWVKRAAPPALGAFLVRTAHLIGDGRSRRRKPMSR